MNKSFYELTDELHDALIQRDEILNGGNDDAEIYKTILLFPYPQIDTDNEPRVHGDTLFPIRHFHIPALVLGLGGKIKPVVYSKTASQIDPPPTLFSLMGISVEHPMIASSSHSKEFLKTALAHVLWTTNMYQERRYRLP